MMGLNKFFYNLTTFLLTLIFLVFVLLLSICLIPIFIYRWIIFKVGPWVNPDYGKMLSAPSAVFGAEWDTVATKTSSSLCVSLKIAGNVTVEQVRKDLFEKVVQLKDSKGEFKYPELQQYYDKYMGYVFYKWDRNFNIENHVRYYSESELTNEHPVDEDQFMYIRRELAEKPFQKNKSLWEVVILKNFKRSDDISDTHYCVMYIRFHHGLADAFAATKLMLNSGFVHSKVQTDLVSQKHITRKKRNPCLQFLSNVSKIIITPFHGMNYIRNARDEYHAFHLPIEKLTGIVCAMESKVISMQVIKDIQKLHGVCYTSVLFAAYGGAIKNYMLEKNIPIPDLLNIGAPVALKGHPDKLRNHATAGTFQVDLGVADPIVRLKKMNETFHAMARSPSVVFFYYLVRMLLLLPINWAKLKVPRGATTGISTFPGFKQEVFYNDCPVTEIGASIASGRRLDTGFGAAIIAYNGGFNIALGSDQSILKTKEDIKYMLKLIEKEFQVFQNYHSTTV